MSLFRWLRKRLGHKLIFSYLIVIIVGVVVLATAAEFFLPRAFQHHLAEMTQMMKGSNLQQLELDLFDSFRRAVNEALGLAALAAALVALIVSILISRQVVSPIHEMMAASRHIAAGHYEERVRVPGNPGRDELDELAELAVSFNQMAAHLERIETMRRQLIGDVAHELRTPLTAIKGSMEGLMDGVLPATEETYQQIYREADRLQRLVKDLQELSLVEARAFELKKMPIPVEELFAATIHRLGRQYEEKGVALETQLPSNPLTLLADEDRIGQVLLNLAGNALQYTPGGGKVILMAERSNGEAQISVRDNGIGIAAEHLPQVFTRFYRVDKSRSRAVGGSGIGLTIVKHLVEAHGGRVWVDSPGPGRGSTFTFTLPVEK